MKTRDIFNDSCLWDFHRGKYRLNMIVGPDSEATDTKKDPQEVIV